MNIEEQDEKIKELQKLPLYWEVASVLTVTDNIAEQGVSAFGEIVDTLPITFEAVVKKAREYAKDIPPSYTLDELEPVYDGRNRRRNPFAIAIHNSNEVEVLSKAWIAGWTAAGQEVDEDGLVQHFAAQRALRAITKLPPVARVRVNWIDGYTMGSRHAARPGVWPEAYPIWEKLDIPFPKEQDDA